MNLRGKNTYEDLFEHVKNDRYALDDLKEIVY